MDTPMAPPMEIAGATPANTQTDAGQSMPAQGGGLGSAGFNAGAAQTNTAPGGHAKLFNMLQMMGVALSATGKAIATHGREGGEPDVAAFQEQQQREQIATQQAEQQKQESALRMQGMTAENNLNTFKVSRLQIEASQEDKKFYSEYQKARADYYIGTGLSPARAGWRAEDDVADAKSAGAGATTPPHVTAPGAQPDNGVKAVAMVPGQDDQTHITSALQAGGATPTTSNIYIPVHDRDNPGAGTTYIKPVNPTHMLSQNDSTVARALYSQANSQLEAAQQMAGVKDAPEVKQAAAKLQMAKQVIDNLDSGKSQMGRDQFGMLVDDAQQLLTLPVSRASTVAAFNKGQAESANAQNQATESGVKAKNAATDEALSQQEKRSTIAKNQQDMQQKMDENVVAYDPNFQNADGSKGGNVVMPRGQAQQNKLEHYKADPSNINSTVGGFNDVQNKINMLADVVADPQTVSKIQGPLAAALLDSKGVQLDAHGVHIPFERINAGAYEENLEKANPETRAYVVAMVNAHEAITQVPRLQTFGKSNRMTQQQMEAAQAMLPAPGGDADMMGRQMVALQTTLDPLRKQMPHMQGAELLPTWLEQRKNAQTTQQPNPAAASHMTPSAQLTGPQDVNRYIHGFYDPKTRTVVPNKSGGQ